MSGEALYERYKDALRRGHVAAHRGQVDVALRAYSEAAAIAPERSTPHTSAGMALIRAKRPADALRHYAMAIQLSPRDEAALLGRAQALTALDRRGDAADAFDALADVRAGSGRLADALDAARRGLELAEGRERRRTLERLIAKLRESEHDEPGRLQLDRALRVLEGVAMPRLESRAPAVAAEEALTPGAVPVAETALNLAEAPVDAPVPAPEPIRAALDRDLPADLDVDALAREADTTFDTGVAGAALERLLDLAAAYRRAGEVDAALEACYTAMSLAPDDIGLHLALVQLYDDRGWGPIATEKLELLDRLAQLDGDQVALARLAAARIAPA